MGFHQSLFCSFSDSRWPTLNSSLWKQRLILTFLSPFNQQSPFSTKEPKWFHSFLEPFFLKKNHSFSLATDVYSRYYKLNGTGHGWIAGLSRGLWSKEYTKMDQILDKKKTKKQKTSESASPSLHLPKSYHPPKAQWSVTCSAKLSLTFSELLHLVSLPYLKIFISCCL